jgi:hypothetical protein
MNIEQDRSTADAAKRLFEQILVLQRCLDGYEARRAQNARADAGVWDEVKHARDKAGQFAKKAGAAIAKGAKTAAGTLIDPIGEKTGEQKFNQFAKRQWREKQKEFRAWAKSEGYDPNKSLLENIRAEWKKPVPPHDPSKSILQNLREGRHLWRTKPGGFVQIAARQAASPRRQESTAAFAYRKAREHPFATALAGPWAMLLPRPSRSRKRGDAATGALRPGNGLPDPRIPKGNYFKEIREADRIGAKAIRSNASPYQDFKSASKMPKRAASIYHPEDGGQWYKPKVTAQIRQALGGGKVSAALKPQRNPSTELFAPGTASRKVLRQAVARERALGHRAAKVVQRTLADR